MGLFASLFGREKRAVTKWGPIGRIPTNGEAGLPADAGVVVNESTALQMVTVYACVRILADTLSSLPIDVFRKKDGARIEVSPAPALIREPLRGVTNFEWMYQLVTSTAIQGNGFAVVTERDALEFATQAEPVHPDEVQIEPVELSRDPRGRRWQYRVGGVIVPFEDVIHVSRFRLAGNPQGLSPINAARQGIGLSLAAERFGSRWFGDGAAPSSVLETDAELNDVQVRTAQESWINSHGGRRFPAVMTGGFKWKPITITPEESQFLQTRKFQRSEIAMLYGVPPHMIGDTEKSTSWGTGIEQQSIGWAVHNLRPWLVCFEHALSAQLPRGQFARFNIDALLRGDIKSRYLAYTQARQAGWMNIDEVRALEDMPPLPNGNGQDYLQPLNYAPIGSPAASGEQAEPSPPSGNDDEGNGDG